eukprot:UN05167
MHGDEFRQFIQNLLKEDHMVFSVGYTDSLGEISGLDWSDLANYTMGQYLVLFLPLGMLICIILVCGIDCSHVFYKERRESIDMVIEEEEIDWSQVVWEESLNETSTTQQQFWD